MNIPSLRKRPAITSALLLVTALAPLSVRAQRPALVGVVSRSAVGPAMPQAAPIGGLRTTPLPRSGAALTRTSSHSLLALRSPSGVAVASSVAPIYWTRVADARVLPYGVALTSSPADRRVPEAPLWIPTYERPRWVSDSTMPVSPRWRDLIVTDVVCNPSGACLERQQRVRAPWVARCDCFAFGDAWNRIWRVAERGRAER